MDLPAQLSSRFEIDQVLREDAETRVLCVRTGDQRHTLKLVSTGRAGAIDQLAGEFSFLKGVIHPHLTAVYEFGRSDDGYWLLREYVDGPTLAEQGPQLAPLERQQVLSGILSGLGHLHSLGLLHLDIKPENILLRQQSGRWHALLTDFGFSTRHSSGEKTHGPARGTPPFVAPEVLLGLPRDTRADLFSLGVTWLAAGPAQPTIDPSVLYASFPSVSFLEALRLDPHTLDPTYATWIEQLLALDPFDRPGSAAEAYPQGWDGSDQELDPEHFAALLRPPALLSAGAELTALEHFLHPDASPTTLWLNTSSHHDARELIERSRFFAARSGLNFRTPLAHTESSHDDLFQPTAQRTTELLLRQARETLTANEPLLLLAHLVDGDDETERLALLAARLLQEEETSFTGARLLVISTMERSSEAWQELAEVLGPPCVIAPPSSDDLTGWLAQLEGVSDATAATGRLARLADTLLEVAGNDPEEIAGALRDRIGTGAIRVHAGHLDFGSLDPATLRPPVSSTVRVRESSPAGRRVLALLDLLGQSATLGSLGGLMTEEEAAAVAGLRGVGLIRSDGDVLSPSRASLGRVARQSLSVDQVAGLAAGICAREAEMSRLSLDRQALVLASAGRVDPVLELLRTRSSELRRLPARTTTALLEDLIALIPGTKSSPVRSLLAEHLVYAGDLERAASIYDELLEESSSTPAEQIVMLNQAGRADLLAARFDRAEERLMEARRLARRPSVRLGRIEKSRIDRGIALARGLKGDPEGALRTLDGALRAARAGGDAAPASLLVLAGTFAYRSGKIARASKAFREGLAAARDAGDEEQVAVALMNLAPLLAGQGQHEKARDSLEEAREIRARLDHPFEEAAVLGHLGIVLRDLGRLDRAESAMRESLTLRRLLGDRVGAAVTLSNLSSVQALSGDVRGAVATVRDALEQLEKTGARMETDLTRCRLALYLTQAGLGEQALEALAPLEPSNSGPRVAAEVAYLHALQPSDTPEATLSQVKEAQARFEAAGDQTGVVRARLLEARILGDCGNPVAARRILTELHRRTPPLYRAQALLEEGRLVDRLGAPEEAIALFLEARDRARDAGLAQERCRAVAEATRSLSIVDPERSVAVGKELPAALSAIHLPDTESEDQDFGTAQRVLGIALAEVLDMNQETPQESSPSHSRVTTEGIPDEVFRTFVTINRSLLGENQIDRLMERLLEHGVTLSGGRRGFIVLIRDGRIAFECRSEDLDPASEEISKSIVLDAIQQNRPLVTANARTDQRLQGRRSIEELDLRSVLCVPFGTESGTRGAIYVDNPIREGAFNPRSIDLLEALAGQAAIAIGNLEHREEIERLNSELKERVTRSERELDDARRLLKKVGGGDDGTTMIAASQEMKDAIDMASRVAPTEIAVLLLGESGTGKELLARHIHRNSKRPDLPFVAENCSAIPETLLESEFFGYVKGAFTGADEDHEGLFARAHGGTLFLDEVGDMPASLQAKLLRVLQEKVVRPVGSMKAREVDVRLIAATHQDLEQLVRDGRFREDLFYRLRGATVRLPPLRQRTDDIDALASFFLQALNQQHGTSKSLSRVLMRAFAQHHWPGNVRELQSEITRLYHFSNGDVLEDTLFEPAVTVRVAKEAGVVTEVRPMWEIERDAILLALKETGGNREEAARRLQISRAAFYVKLKKYDLAAKAPPSRRRKPS